MTEKLKPCPFCGSKLKVHDKEDPRLSALWRTGGNNNRFVISCYKCGAYSGYALSAQEAIAMWNRRASE